MKDFVGIITEKTHASCIKRLEGNVPSSVMEYINLELLRKVAESLSSVTQNNFIYTGIITEKEDCLYIEYKSSDKMDTISMLVHYDEELNKDGFDFEGLNLQMEKTIGSVKTIEKKEEIVEPETKEVLPVVEDEEKEETKVDNSSSSQANGILDKLDLMTDAEKKKIKPKTKQVISVMEKINNSVIKEEVVENPTEKVNGLLNTLDVLADKEKHKAKTKQALSVMEKMIDSKEKEVVENPVIKENDETSEKVNGLLNAIELMTDQEKKKTKTKRVIGILEKIIDDDQ